MATVEPAFDWVSVVATPCLVGGYSVVRALPPYAHRGARWALFVRRGVCCFVVFTVDCAMVALCVQAMDIHGIDVVFEGQMYLGPPGSGAPAHWHGAALNVMAYGKKRWCVWLQLLQ